MAWYSRLFRTKYGSFSDDGSEYVITTPETPRPWINVISNGDYGMTVSQAGSGYSWRTHAQLNRITRWEQDLIKDEWGKYVYLRDEDGALWSAGWKPVCREPEEYVCRHGIGYSCIEAKNHGIGTELLMFVPEGEPLEVWKLTVRNHTRKRRSLRLFTYFEWGLGAAPDWHREFHRSFIETAYEPGSNAIFASKRLWEIPTDRGHWNAMWGYTAFHSCSLKPASYDTDKESFLGMYGNQRSPAAVQAGRLADRTGKWLDPIASLNVNCTLDAGEERTVLFTLGAAETKAEAHRLIRKYRSVQAADRALGTVRRAWQKRLRTVRVDTPDEAMNIVENSWLKYQAISGRLWGRTAYYQTGGAFGFRDQLQDSQIFLPIDPSMTKAQLRLHARHQFSDGTVYHWWHPISEVGLRNAISDNRLWLPFVVNSYLEETADLSLLDLKEPFVDERRSASLYDHCIRAIDKSLKMFSRRGLPLIGAGDWNDGLSAVGLGMRGESIWLGHFLHRILLDFSAIAVRRGDKKRAASYRTRAKRLRKALNSAGWDGSWYFRATKDSGEKIGSRRNSEGRIYLNAQTWSVIAGVADEQRAHRVMDEVEARLDSKSGPLLLAPAYRTPDPEIGYLTRYAPGARENGGVYTHAATWSVIAEAMLGRGDKAHEFWSKLNPVRRGLHPDEYVAEPYVTPGNIEGPDSAYYGRGGWTWYTGSAAWLFKVGLEWILGIRPTFDGLIVDPCIPSSWSGFTVHRRFRGAFYTIEVRNPRRVQSGVEEYSIDGKKFVGHAGHHLLVLPVFAAGSTHTFIVVLGSSSQRK